MPKTPIRTRFTWIFLVAIALGLTAWAPFASQPTNYAALGRVLLPEGTSAGDLAPAAEAVGVTLHAKRGSRVLLVQHVSSNPEVAARTVNRFLRQEVHAPILVVDEASVPREPLEPSLLPSVIAAALAAALLMVAALLFRPRRRTMLVDLEGDADAVKIEPLAGRRGVYVLRAPRERVGAYAAQAARRYRVVIVGRKAVAAA